MLVPACLRHDLILPVPQPCPPPASQTPSFPGKGAREWRTRVSDIPGGEVLGVQGLGWGGPQTASEGVGFSFPASRSGYPAPRRSLPEPRDWDSGWGEPLRLWAGKLSAEMKAVGQARAHSWVLTIFRRMFPLGLRRTPGAFPNDAQTHTGLLYFQGSHLF